MHGLRFRGVDVDGDRSGTGALAFPGSVRDVLTRPDPKRMNAEELATSMEATLQRMEASLDLLRQESDSLLMPGLGRDDGGPPRAA